MAVKNIRIKDISGQDTLHPETDASLVITSGGGSAEDALSSLSARVGALEGQMGEGGSSLPEEVAALKAQFADGASAPGDAALRAVSDANGDEIAATYAKAASLGSLAYEDEVPASAIPDGSITSAKIADGAISDRDVATDAAIAQSKVSGLVAALADSASLSKPNEFASAQSFPNGASFGAVGISIGGVTLTQPELSSAKANAAEVPALSASLDEERSQRIASDDALSTRIGNLEGKTTRLFYGDGGEGDPDADRIQAFVDGLPADPPYEPPYSGVAVVVRWAEDGTLHVWHYYENIPGWQDDGIDTVTDFTDTSAGIITGSSEDGYVSADGGRGRVSGWGTAVRGSGLTEGAILIGAGGVGAQASIYSPEEEFTGSAAALPTSAAVQGKLSEYLPLSGGSMYGSLSMGAYPLITGGHFEVTPEGDALFAGASTFTGTVQMNGVVTFAGEGNMDVYKDAYCHGTLYANIIRGIGGNISCPDTFKVYAVSSGGNYMDSTGLTVNKISTASGALAVSISKSTYDTYTIGGQLYAGGPWMQPGILTTIPYVTEKIADAINTASSNYVKRIQPPDMGDYAYMTTMRADTNEDGLVSISQRADPSTIARRWDSGDIDVALEPTEPQHAASKSYVDAQKAAAESSAADALSAHEKDHSNPHGVTKAQVGLGSVEDAPMDDSPTDGSANYVSSGGVKAALSTRLGYTVASVGGDADPKYAYTGGSTDSAAVSISQEGTITAEVSDGGVTLAKLASDAKDYIGTKVSFLKIEQDGILPQSRIPQYSSLSDVPSTSEEFKTAFGTGSYNLVNGKVLACFVFIGSTLNVAYFNGDGEGQLHLDNATPLENGAIVSMTEGSTNKLYEVTKNIKIGSSAIPNFISPINCRFDFYPIFANFATLSNLNNYNIYLNGSGTGRGGIGIVNCFNVSMKIDTTNWNAINDNGYMTFSITLGNGNKTAMYNIFRAVSGNSLEVGNLALNGYKDYQPDSGNFNANLGTWGNFTAFNDEADGVVGGGATGPYTTAWLNFGCYDTSKKTWQLYQDGVLTKTLKLNYLFDINHNGVLTMDVVPYFADPSVIGYNPTEETTMAKARAMSVQAEPPEPIMPRIPEGAVGIFSVDSDGHTINAMTGEAID